MSGEQLEPGTLLNGRYRILRVIGKGGMGTVYQAEHVRLDTILAVKEVRAPQGATDDAQALLEQCEHEARFLVKLHHPNLPQVTDAFLEDDRFFVVMEYIEGVTLEARERQAGAALLPVGTVIEWALQVADVLAYLHSQDPPIIFRDLKPANIMVQADGRVRLIDFGIARRFQPGAVKDTNLLGSVGYSPPEQFGRHQTDTRTDIYALGATLHNLLTGQDPSHSPFKFASAQTLNPAVPDPLSRLIDCCLRLDADARPQSVHEVAMELLAIRDSLPTMPIAPDAAAAAASVEALAPPLPPTGPNIILTNTALMKTGKTQRGSQKMGSASLGSDRLGSQALSGPSGPTSGVPAAATAPSGEFAPAGPARSARVWLAGAAAVVALMALAAWMVSANTKRPVPTRKPNMGVVSTPAQPAGTPQPEGSSPVAPAPGMQVSPGTTPPDSGAAPITSLNRVVTFGNVRVKEVAADAQGRNVMRIQVAGMAEGQPGDVITIAAFFYDSQNSPVASQMPQGPYSSRDGKLSIAATVTLTGQRMPFDVLLEVPVAAFAANLTSGLQFHCVAFYGDQRIGETRAYTAIAPELLGPATGTQSNPGASPLETSGEAPGAPTMVRPSVSGSGVIHRD